MTTDDATLNRTLSRSERFNSWFWLTIARHLPRNLVYACGVVMGSRANTGRFRHDNVGGKAIWISNRAVVAPE
jgi:hypothetical protein